MRRATRTLRRGQPASYAEHLPKGIHSAEVERGSAPDGDAQGDEARWAFQTDRSGHGVRGGRGSTAGQFPFGSVDARLWMRSSWMLLILLLPALQYTS